MGGALRVWSVLAVVATASAPAAGASSGSATATGAAAAAGTGSAASPGAAAAVCAAVPPASRIACGIYETRRSNMHGDYDFGAACRSRGCCYSVPPAAAAGASSSVAAAPTSPSCYWRGKATPIKTAHLIQSNHFDAGYTAGPRNR